MKLLKLLFLFSYSAAIISCGSKVTSITTTVIPTSGIATPVIIESQAPPYFPTPLLTPSNIATLTPSTTPTEMAQAINVSSRNNGGSMDLDGFTAHVNSLVWSEDGKTFLVSNKTNLVYFDVLSKKVTLKPLGIGTISSIALSPDKKTLAAIAAEPLADSIFVRFINLETGDEITTIKVDKAPIINGQARVVYGGTGVFAPDGKTFILESGKQITLWNVTSGNQIKDIFECDPNFWVSGLFLNSAKNLLFTTDFKQDEWSHENTFLRWNTNTWKLSNTFNGDFTGLSFSLDGNTFSLIGSEAYVFNLDTLTELLNFTGSQNLGSYDGERIAYDPSGRYVAVSYDARYAAEGSLVNIYNATTGKFIRQLSSNVWELDVLEYSPDGTRLAGGGGYENPGAVTIWDLSQP